MRRLTPAPFAGYKNVFARGRTIAAIMLDDVQTLRRIALLVMRARDDESPGPIHDGLEKITPVIERMKRSLAIGSPIAGKDVASLHTLVRHLPPDRNVASSPREIVRWSAISELRELVAHVHHESRVA